MNTPLLAGALFSVATFLLQSCGSGGSHIRLTEDSTAVSNGKVLFRQHCSGCHNFLQDGIGPQLSGVSGQVSPEWLLSFIKDPQNIINAGDERAKKLMDRYPAAMPSFAHIGEEKIREVVAFLRSVKETGMVDDDTAFLQNPLPEKIAPSGLSLTLQEIARMPYSSEESPRTRISKIDLQPGSDLLYIMDLRGRLYVLKNGRPEVYLDLKAQKKNFIDEPGLATGFGSFAFHPDFRKNGLLYTTHTEAKGTGEADFSYNDSIPVEVQWVITEWKTPDPGAAAFRGTSRELFRINFVTGMHGMQEIVFNPFARPGSKDYGNLYLGVGDGASVEYHYPALVQHPEQPWGTIFRINPQGKNSKNGRYGIPDDNPFANDSGKVHEIYAYGFRNPHRISWTRDKKMIAVNIGQSNIESIYIIQPGNDYGWPVREGNFMIFPEGNINKVHALPANDSTFRITYPVAEFDHDEGRAIAGGFEYFGTAVKQLRNKYIFGDVFTGRLFYVETKDLKSGQIAKIRELGIYSDGRPVTMQKLCGNERTDLRLAIDHQGEMYVLTKPDGKIYKITGVVKP